VTPEQVHKCAPSHADVSLVTASPLGGADRWFAVAPDAQILVGSDLVLRAANRAAEALFGWESAGRLGRSVAELIHPDDLAMAAVSFSSVQGKDVGTPIELRVSTVAGWRHVELVGRWLPEDGGILLAALRPVDARRRWDLAAGRADTLEAILDAADAVTAHVARDGTVVSHSRALTRRLGHDPEAVQGRSLHSLVDPRDRDRFARFLAGLLAEDPVAGRRYVVEVRLLDSVGGAVPHELTVVALSGEADLDGYVVTAFDVRRLREAQVLLEQQALQDDLTGLPNRRHLLVQMARHLEAGECLAVAFVDLDRFKPVNDLFGHDAGDTVLRAVADRLRELDLGDGMVARHGGDEFVVIGVTTQDGAARDCERLRDVLDDVLARPLPVDTGPLQIGASVGVTWVQGPAEAEHVLAEADARMYAAKRARRGAPVSVISVDERRELAEELVGAVERGEVGVHFQPILDLLSGEVAGVEALVRWTSPHRGLVPPAGFLPIAEDLGLGRQIDAYVLSEACAAVAAYNRTRGRRLSLTVNVSAENLVDVSLPGTVSEVLAETGLAPDLLWIEITEHAVLQRHATGPATTVLAAFDRLHALGVRLAVDDFGTGFSSLASLVSYPIHMLKIDQSFVERVDQDARSAAMVEALVALTSRLGIMAVAEGIERPQQLMALRELGCRYGQGYLLGRPSTELPDVLLAPGVAAGQTALRLVDDQPA
jgi:diguanylate cyclase (GGDEF)-like protein/PAS domain S-box-containing protein